MKIGVIDIGSNSIRYMEAESSNNGFCFSNKSVYTTRLAGGQSNSKKLTNIAMERSAKVLADLYESALEKNIPCFAYATSALREASNQNEFLSLVHSKVDLDIAILSGNQEARYAYDAAMPDGGGLIDIGGGSFQIITESSQFSYPLGCVRLHDRFPEQSLPKLLRCIPDIIPGVKALPKPNHSQWKAVGGTATTLGALTLNLKEYDSNLVSNSRFTQVSLLSLLNDLNNKSDLERSRIPLLKDRYDVIIGGGALLLTLMKELSIRQIHICDTDGLEGYAIHILNKKNREWLCT